MVTIYRFSEDGFIPKYQNKLIEDVEYWRNFKIDNSIPKWQIETFKDIINRMTNINTDEIKNSTYAFINKPSYNESRLLLNHLSRKEKYKRKWYKAEIDENAIVYADDSIVGKVEHLDKFVLNNFISKYLYNFAIIIPKESIKLIKNVEIINNI